jgi:hypothetical protein
MTGIVQALLAGYGAVSAAASDAYFYLTTLLLPGNGTNGAQNNTFLDSSTNNFTITRNGNTTQGTFSPFSQTGWSMYAGSSGATVVGAYLNGESDFAFGTGDFTIEMFINLSPSGANQVFYDSRPAASNGAYQTIYLDNSATKLKYYVDSADRITQTSTFTYNVWHHVVITRTGTSTKMFVDGVQEGSTYTDSTNYLIGTNRPSTANGNNNSESPVGYISNLRVVKGSGPYQSAGSSITVPTSPLTPVTNTVLLTLQSNRFVDTNTQVAAKTINTVNNPSIQAFSPFAPTIPYSAATVGGSGYFDGTVDYLGCGAQTAYAFGTGVFTVEAWVYVTSRAAEYNIASTRGNSPSANGWSLSVVTGGGVTVYTDNYVFNGVGTVPLNAWTHIAFVRSGTGTNQTAIYINGASIATATNSQNFSNTTLAVGASNDGSQFPFLGYISGFRMLKGTALTSFTLTSPPTNIANTSILTNFTNAGITDATAKNDLETVGNAQISTTQSKFGGSSMSFDGTGDWLLIPHTVDQMLGTGSFTIELWVYRNSSSTYGLVGKGTGTTGWLVSLNSSNQVVFTYGSSTITSSGTVSATTWTYIAVVREGTGTNQTKIYINGSNDGTGTVSTDFNQTNAMYVGADRTGGSAFNGYIDDLRITRGQARTVTTTPTSAFALQ